MSSPSPCKSVSQDEHAAEHPQGACLSIDASLVTMIKDSLDSKGYAVFPSGCTSKELDALELAFVSSSTWSTREPNNRWSCTHPSNNEQPGWSVLWTAPNIVAVLEAVANHCESTICVGPCGGDMCYPNARAQQLHSDYPKYDLCSMRHGFSLAVSIAVHDVSDGPLRIVPWDKTVLKGGNGEWYPTTPLTERPLAAELLCMKRSDCLIRDVRAPHGGSSHFGSVPRMLPGIQFYCTACCTGRCNSHQHFGLAWKD